MDEDTKLVLDAWRVLLVKNYQLQRRVVDLENILEKGKADVGKRIDVGGDYVPWRRVGLGRRGDDASGD